jgi:hypothetical protein
LEANPEKGIRSVLDAIADLSIGELGSVICRAIQSSPQLMDRVINFIPKSIAESTKRYLNEVACNQYGSTEKNIAEILANLSIEERYVCDPIAFQSQMDAADAIHDSVRKRHDSDFIGFIKIMNMAIKTRGEEMLGNLGEEDFDKLKQVMELCETVPTVCDAMYKRAKSIILNPDTNELRDNSEYADQYGPIIEKQILTQITEESDLTKSLIFVGAYISYHKMNPNDFSFVARQKLADAIKLGGKIEFDVENNTISAISTEHAENAQTAIEKTVKIAPQAKNVTEITEEIRYGRDLENVSKSTTYVSTKYGREFKDPTAKKKIIQHYEEGTLGKQLVRCQIAAEHRAQKAKVADLKMTKKTLKAKRSNIKLFKGNVFNNIHNYAQISSEIKSVRKTRKIEKDYLKLLDESSPNIINAYIQADKDKIAAEQKARQDHDNRIAALAAQGRANALAATAVPGTPNNTNVQPDPSTSFSPK